MTNHAGKEPTEAQVEAAAKAVADALFPRWNESDRVKASRNQGSLIRKSGEAALVAAADAAPQAESEERRRFFAEYGRGTAHPTMGAAPVQPSRTVDEGKIAEVIRNEMNRIRELYPLEDMDAAPIARAVVEAIGGEARAARE